MKLENKAQALEILVIYSVEYIDPNEKFLPQPEPKFYRFSDIPEDEAKRLISSNKKYRYLQRFDNGEWVAKNNYKKQKQLHSQGFRVNCYVSFVYEGMAAFI
jgi:hypothetical protein